LLQLVARSLGRSGAKKFGQEGGWLANRIMKDLIADGKIFHFLVTGLSINIYVASQFNPT